EFGGKFLAKLDAPLIESVDAENLRLDENTMLIERDQTPESERVKLVVNQRQRRTVAREDAMGRNAFHFAFGKVLRLQLRPRFVQRAALHQSFRLRKAVCEQHFMLVVKVLFMTFRRNDEFKRDGVGTLMQKLEEGVLAVGAGLAPYDR